MNDYLKRETATDTDWLGGVPKPAGVDVLVIVGAALAVILALCLT